MRRPGRARAGTGAAPGYEVRAPLPPPRLEDGPAAQAAPRAPGGSAPVRIMGGFFANLPPRGVQFFDRTYDAAFPKPLVVVVGRSWQKGHLIWQEKVPANQVIVIRDLAWTAYRNNNIGVGEPTPIAPGSLSDSLGFQLSIGNRWTVDIKNNLQGAGSPTVTGSGGNLGIGQQEFSVPSAFDPLGSSFAARFGAQGGFAIYGRPGMLLESKFFAFNVPPVEVLKVQFRINAWLVPSQLFDHLERTGQWGL
jgi:hypothetical protein